MKKNMICDSYADDTFLDDLDAKSLKESIKRTGIIEDEQRHTFELRYEGAVDDFQAYMGKTCYNKGCVTVCMWWGMLKN